MRELLRRLGAAFSRVAAIAGVRDLAYSVFAVFLALGVGALLIFAFGYDVGRAFSALFQGAFGSVRAVSQTLTRATPLLFTGLAVAVAFKVGLFNIGGEGQMYWGALASAVVSLALVGLPVFFIIAGAVIAAALAGALWGVVPGVLKAQTGAHEVITTIMLNSIAVLGTTHLTANYFKAPGAVDQTMRLPVEARMPHIIDGTGIGYGIVIGICVVVAVHWLFKRSSLGYDFQAVGFSPGAAAYGGIASKRMIVLSMALGGAMAGIAGSMVVLAQLGRFVTGFSPGYGFTGIAVAVLGRTHPWGVLLAALLFGALEAGGMTMQLSARIPNDLMTVVQGLVILFVAAPGLMKIFPSLRPKGGTKESSHVA
ncbi:MAG: ABC transporter permease [Spirochaetaceae bacterium]|nr:MAG: ABC transporter permease [Spirochaetaceae bacterium]